MQIDLHAGRRRFSQNHFYDLEDQRFAQSQPVGGRIGHNIARLDQGDDQGWNRQHEPDNGTGDSDFEKSGAVLNRRLILMNAPIVPTRVGAGMK